MKDPTLYTAPTASYLATMFSKFKASFLIAALCLSSSLHAQNWIEFPNGDRLTGKLLTLSNAGEASFLLSGSTTPVTIKPGSVLKIKFQDPTVTGTRNSERLTLINGDELACQLLAIDSKSVSFQSSFAGQFSIDREMLAKIEFDDKLATQTPINKINWSKSSPKLKGWTFNSTSVKRKGAGEISHKPAISQNFILKYRTTWNSAKPRFRVYFAADAAEVSKVEHCYHLEANRHSLQLFRSTPSRPRKKLGEIAVDLRDRKSSTVDIELKVDRRTKQIAVFVDNQHRRTFKDEEASPAGGSFIILQSLIPTTDSLTFSNYQVIKWTGGLLHTLQTDPDELDSSVDTLHDRKGESLTGDLEKVVNKDNQKQLLFREKDAENALHIPFSKVLMLYLKESTQDPLPTSPYTLKMSKGEILNLTSIAINDTSATAVHPILGSFQIKRDAMSSLSLQQPSTDDE